MHVEGKEVNKVTETEKVHVFLNEKSVFSYLVTVVHSRDYLSEEVSRLPLAQAPPLTDIVVQLALAGVLHHNHDLVLVLKH